MTYQSRRHEWSYLWASGQQGPLTSQDGVPRLRAYSTQQPAAIGSNHVLEATKHAARNSTYPAHLSSALSSY